MAGRRKWARSRRGSTQGGREGTQRRKVCSRMRGLSKGRPHSTRACSRQAWSRRACSRQVCSRQGCSRQACSRRACSRQVCSRQACSRRAHSRPAGRGRSYCRLAGSRGWTRSSLGRRGGSGGGPGHSSWGHSRGARSSSLDSRPPARRSLCRSHRTRAGRPGCCSSGRWSRQTGQRKPWWSWRRYVCVSEYVCV